MSNVLLKIVRACASEGNNKFDHSVYAAFPLKFKRKEMFLFQGFAVCMFAFFPVMNLLKMVQ